MKEHVYKSVEITGSSNDSIEAAVHMAVLRASESLHNLRWFEVKEIRGQIEDGHVNYWQVTMKLGLTLD